MALRDRGLQIDVLPKVPRWLEIAQKSISTDLGAGEMLSLGELGVWRSTATASSRW